MPKSNRGVPPPKPNPWLLLRPLVVLAIIALAWWQWPRTKNTQPAQSPTATPSLLPPEAQVFAQYAGSASCKDCHADAFAHWEKSNHGLAERSVSPALDASAFEPAREITHGTQKSRAFAKDGHFFVETAGLNNSRGPFKVVRAIGNDPLRQYLVEAPGGRLQTLELAFDPKKGDWFDIYGTEDRVPGEWGHWTGRGMNWNHMCASCHNTRPRKNYDAATDTFHTSMAELTVGCESCHGPMKAHVDWRKQYPTSKEPDPTVRKMSRDAMLDTCGACHARRRELTGDFIPGDAFAKHFQLTTVDETDLYYPDGQVRDELYEYGSFLSSKMHHAGVRCVDCHQPHSTKTILPGDALCLRCHTAGAVPQTPAGDPLALTVPAPPIDATSHGHHAPGTASCVSCHMPVTTYMQRHPRHDHSFSIPDPLLTKDLGIPNACARCHTEKEKDATWAAEAAAKWWGDKMERPSRKRARAVAAAREGKSDARSALIALLHEDPSPYWKASFLRLLAPWAGSPDATQALLQYAQHPSALVRTAALHSLSPLAQAGHDAARQTLDRKLTDPDLAVRIAAAWGTVATADPTSKVGQELAHTLAIAADQPAGQMQLALLAQARGDTSTAVAHAARAVEWDAHSPHIRREYAVLLGGQGRSSEALAQMREAARLAPKDADIHHLLGLAWNEAGSLAEAVQAFETATKLDPQMARSWYNLGLARNQLGDPSGAIAALRQGELADPRDARIPFARATIHARLREMPEARAAAIRARDLGSREAAEMLQNQ